MVVSNGAEHRRHPGNRARRPAGAADTSEVAAQDAVNTLLSAGLLRETTGKKRGRVYLATEIFAAIMPEEAQAAAAPSTEGAPA